MRFLNSVKSLYAAVLILFLTFGLGYYIDRETEAVHARQLTVNTSLERMTRLNQELSHMLAIAVFKNSILGTASYESVKANLQLTMANVIEVTKGQSFQEQILSLRDSLAQLREFESQAIGLMAEEKWDEASAILLGDEAVMATKMYEVDSETAVGFVRGELSAATRRFERVRNVADGLRVVALALLLWVGIMFSRRTSADISEQRRLRDEISAAYAGMEARVLERTAELEETSGRLAMENREREKSDQRTRLILNSAGEGIFGIDADGRGIFFNDAAVQMLGYAADELIGKPIDCIVRDKPADNAPSNSEALSLNPFDHHGQARSHSALTLWRKNGASFLSASSVTPIVDDQGANAGAVVVFRDITEEQKNRDELQQRMDELERFNRLTTGREERMIELKRDINKLLVAQGLPKKYRSADDGLAVAASDSVMDAP